MQNNLARLKADVLSMRRNRRRGRTRPHKLIMLLAVIRMAEDGLLVENRIQLDDTLISRFEYYFYRHHRADDMCQPGPPFFHLRSSPFWRHRVHSGMDEMYAKTKTTGGGVQGVLDIIEYAYLSDYAFSVIQDPEARRRLRAFVEELLLREE